MIILILFGLFITWVIVDSIRLMCGRYQYIDLLRYKIGINMEKLKPMLDNFCFEKKYNWDHGDYVNLIDQILEREKGNDIVYYKTSKYGKISISYDNISWHNSPNVVSDYLEKQKKLHFRNKELIDAMNQKLQVNSLEESYWEIK